MSTKRQALGRGLAALIPAAAGSSPASARSGIPTMPPPPPGATTPGSPAAGGGAVPTASASPVGASIPVGTSVVPREGLRTVGIEEVHPARNQPRKTFDDARLDELATSIRTQGVIQPLVVRIREGGGYEIIAGERRWRASQRAGLHSVPVVVRDIAHARAFELAMVENLQREDLNPIEEAEGFDRLIRDFGYSQESLAARVGKDRTTVSNALRLLKLPPGVRGLVIAGRLSMGHARAILGLEALAATAAAADGETKGVARAGTAPSPGAIAEHMEQMARKVVARELSVRQVEALVRREKDAALTDGASVEGDAAAGTPEPTASARDLANRLTRSLGTRVNVVESGPGHGRVEIHYASLDQLDGLLKRILG